MKEDKTVYNLDYDIQPWGTWVAIELIDGTKQKGDVHLAHYSPWDDSCRWTKTGDAIRQVLKEKYGYNLPTKAEKTLTDEEVKVSAIMMKTIQVSQEKLAKMDYVVSFLNEEIENNPEYFCDYLMNDGPYDRVQEMGFYYSKDKYEIGHVVGDDLWQNTTSVDSMYNKIKAGKMDLAAIDKLLGEDKEELKAQKKANKGGKEKC